MHAAALEDLDEPERGGAFADRLAANASSLAHSAVDHLADSLSMRAITVALY